jgi:carnitine-CoA ligase
MTLSFPAGPPPGGDTVIHALARAVDAAPDRVFLDFSGDRYTYAEVDVISTRLAHGLRGLGVDRGQTVVTQMDSHPDAVFLWLAINKLGAIWVPINTAYRGDFLRHHVDDAQAQLAICDPDYLERIVEVAAGAPALQTVLVRGDVPDVPAGTLNVGALDDHRGDDDTPIPNECTPGDLAFLIYTSGTTGPSKGCMIPHNFICNQGYQSNLAIPPLPGEVTWTCLPLFHAAAVNMVMAAMLSCCTAAVVPRFSVRSFWSEIEQSGAGTAILMASIFPLLAGAPDDDTMLRCRGQLRAVSGVPVTPEVRKVWQERFGVPFINSFAYGLTEGVRLSMYREGDEPPPDGSCGKIADDFFEVEIHDDEDRPVPDGEKGEIVFRPRHAGGMFAGYWRRPEETTAVWRNLWMHTGDLGRVEDGYLYFVDRKKDYLRSRGENVSSFELERTFMGHPAVADVAVHAASGGVGEDAHIKATIVLRESIVLRHEDLCQWSIEQLPYFAVPRYFEFRDALPKTPNLRTLKYQLRDEGVTAATWDREAAGIQVRRR